MNKFTHPLGFSIILMLALASCGLPSSQPAENQALIQQATPSPAQLELSVQVDTSVQYTTVNQIIKFNFGVKNTGSGSASGGIAISGVAATCSPVNTAGDKNDSFDPNEVVNCSADYPITQADLDKGSVALVAVANLNQLQSNQVTANIPVGLPKVLTITSTADPITYSQADQKITFTYTIKNGGDTTIGPAQFTVSDSLIGNTPFTCGDANVTLPPQQTVSCTATYKISQDDITQGSISNLASASGGGGSSTQPASSTVNKGAGNASNNSLTNGNTITHTVINGEWVWQIARCYGADPNKVVQANPQLSDPSQIKRDMILTIPNIGSNGKVYGPPCVVPHTVATGDTWDSIAKQYNADPSILQMVKANSLTVGSTLIVPINSGYKSSTTPSTNTTGLSLTTTANPTTFNSLGQQIVFTYVIKNTGNNTLGPDQFKVKDDLIGNQAIKCGDGNATLPPNLTISCTAIYTVSQADMNQGSISNYATASGGGASASQPQSATVNKGGSSLTLTTSASPASYNQAGQQINFTYVVKNSGTANVGPTQFTITDTLIGANPINCGAADTNLAPNATVTCTAIYTTTQNDASQSSISNYATASATGAGQSQPASATVNKGSNSLSLTVTADIQAYSQQGQKITFTYAIKNNGSSNLGPAQFTVSDTLIGPSSFNCGNADAVLAPNATVTCTNTYTVLQSDMNQSSVSNYAIATGGGAQASQPTSITINKQ